MRIALVGGIIGLGAVAVCAIEGWTAKALVFCGAFMMTNMVFGGGGKDELHRNESSLGVQRRIIVAVLTRFRCKLFESRIARWGYPSHALPPHAKFLSFDDAASQVKDGDVVTLCGMAGNMQLPVRVAPAIRCHMPLRISPSVTLQFPSPRSIPSCPL